MKQQEAGFQSDNGSVDPLEFLKHNFSDKVSRSRRPARSNTLAAVKVRNQHLKGYFAKTDLTTVILLKCHNSEVDSKLFSIYWGTFFGV
jgi:hypothetical protein